MKIEMVNETLAKVTWDDGECPVGYKTFEKIGVVFDSREKYACRYCGALVGRNGARKYWKRVGLPQTGEFLENHEICSLCVNPEAVNLGPR